MFSLIFSTVIIVLGIMQFSIATFFTDNQIIRLYIIGDCDEPVRFIKNIRNFFKSSGLILAVSGVCWGLAIIPDILMIIILIIFGISLYIFTHANSKHIYKRK